MSDKPAQIPEHIQQVALLVDGENISADFAGAIIIRAAKFGQLSIKRVYGNSTKIQKWDDAPGFRTIHSGSGKNGADILLSIEAVDLAHGFSIGTFVIASSDQDFSHLAHYLRERGFKVVGLGEAKAPMAFRKACSSFVDLPVKDDPPAKTSKEQAAPDPKTLDDLDKKVLALIGKAPKMKIATLGQMMYKKHGIKISTRPEKNWSRYLRSKSELYNCEPKGPNACVRLKNP